MNTHRIKEIFEKLVVDVTKSFDSDVSGQGSPSGRIPVMRGGTVLPERAGEAYMQALEDITDIVHPEEGWSRFTVDDVLWEHVSRVLRASADEREVVIRQQTSEIVRRFGEPLSKWTVDLQLYGMDLSCADLAFGKLTFFSEDVSAADQYPLVPSDLLGIRQMFARLEFVLKSQLGSRVSEMLSSPETEFSRRVLSGYALAGTACVDAHPERAFLMFAIALEALVLSRDTKTELTHQLAMRVAHLIGEGPDGRKHAAHWVKELYGRRSKIVHTGEYGVSRTELGLIRAFCIATLANLALRPAFEHMAAAEQLEAWFQERMLEGPQSWPE